MFFLTRVSQCTYV